MENKQVFIESLKTLCDELESKEKELKERETLLDQREATYQASLVKCKELQDEEMPVTFDIGGQLFKFKVEQIRKYPESLLCVLMEKWTKENEIAFIARSALVFSYIDCFLKDAPLPLLCQGDIKKEFAYYGLPCPLPDPAKEPTSFRPIHANRYYHGLK